MSNAQLLLTTCNIKLLYRYIQTESLPRIIAGFDMIKNSYIWIKICKLNLNILFRGMSDEQTCSSRITKLGKRIWTCWMVKYLSADQFTVLLYTKPSTLCRQLNCLIMILLLGLFWKEQEFNFFYSSLVPLTPSRKLNATNVQSEFHLNLCNILTHFFFLANNIWYTSTFEYW